MSYNKRNQMPASYDESVMTAMAVVPQNNNRNVTTMYHPVIEGVNPSGANVACLNKCMKIPSNFTMEQGTEVLLVNMSARGSVIMYRYQFNDYGHLVKVDSVRTPFDVTQYRLQKPVSGVIKIFCNTITGTDFTLSGQVSALAMYDLPQPVPNYEDLARYSIMPTFSRINTSLEDGVVLVMLPSPWEFQSPATIEGDKEYITSSEAMNQEPIITGTITAPANPDMINTYNEVRLSSGYYVCGSKLLLNLSGEHGKTIACSYHLGNGIKSETSDLIDVTFGPTGTEGIVIDVPNTYDVLSIQVASSDANPVQIKYSLFSMDPLLYRDSDLKHLVYLQGSLSPKNIVVSGELRKQIVPLTEYIPVTEMKLPIPFDPKVFEACAMLAQMPDYGIVLRRSEYERLPLITLDNVASVSSGECGLADYWKMAVAALKKVGIKPAQLGKKILEAGTKYGKNLLDYAEQQGYAEDAPEECNDLKFGCCKDGDGHESSLDFDEEKKGFQKCPERGEVETQQNQEVVMAPPHGRPQPLSDVKDSQVIKEQQRQVKFKSPINNPMRVMFQSVPVMFQPMVMIPIINPREMEKLRKSIISPPVMGPKFQFVNVLKNQKCFLKEVKENEEKKPKHTPKKGTCSDAVEETSTLNFDETDDDEPIMTQSVESSTKQNPVDEIQVRAKMAADQAPNTQFIKQQVVSDMQQNLPAVYVKKATQRAKDGVTIEEDVYKQMALFKLNGGWKQYVMNLYATTVEGRLKWKEIVEEETTSQHTKAIVTRQQMVVANEEYKMFQPFLVQTGKFVVMATVVVHFTETRPTGYNFYSNVSDEVVFAVNEKMKTTKFGGTTYTANNEGYTTEGVDIDVLLCGTSQWSSLVSQLSSNLRAVQKKLYIVIDFDTSMDELSGGSFIGALDCCVFGECPFLFVEYTLCHFSGVSWPTLVAKEFKQVAFDPTIAKSLLPEWWPTSLPISVWYETPKSFASWSHTATVKPQPFSKGIVNDITKYPVLAGPIERQWLFKFSPPQLYAVNVVRDENYFKSLLKELGSYKAKSQQAQAKYDRNYLVANQLANELNFSQYTAMGKIVTPTQAAFMDAARYGMSAASPGALGAINTLISQVSSVNFYKAYNKHLRFEKYLRDSGLDKTQLSDVELAKQKKAFKSNSTAGQQPKKSNEQRKADKKKKSQILLQQLTNEEKTQIVEY